MAVGMSTAVRNARLDAITAAAGGSALLRIYDGSRPATGGAAPYLQSPGELPLTLCPVCNRTATQVLSVPPCLT